MNHNNNKSGNAALVIVMAVIMVAGISFLPLSQWSNGVVKDFNLLADIVSDSVAADTSVAVIDVTDIADVDPELLKAQIEETDAHLTSVDETSENRIADNNRDETALSASATTDSASVMPSVKPSRVGELVVIEDYTSDGRGLRSLRSAISSGSLARIAVVGDSYIEGDIFTQDLREKLQSTYGGQGVGYVNMHSDFPGFRRSIKQGGKGWKTYTALKKANDRYMALSEQYSIPSGLATSTYQGTKSYPHAESWSRSSFLFIAPHDTRVSYRTGNGEWLEKEIIGDSVVQAITVDGLTGNFEIKTDDSSLVGLGVWLDGTAGISVDCMSSRGFSGITLTRINPSLCRQMSHTVPYNLIILEFGINAMSSKQKDYRVYANRMVNVVNHVRTCYPGADILLMGIGDRGEKQGSAVHSMKVTAAMVNAQRDAARRAHCLFWDTREAMGGEDAIVDWARKGMANKDYIHLTYKGGATLAEQLFNALQNELQ